MNEAKKLDKLSQSDPDAYLQVLEGKDDMEWMLALKELDSERYTVELSKRVAATRAIPADELFKNLQAYRTLLKLEPEHEQFAQKIKHYETKLEEAKSRSKLCDGARKSEAYIYAKQIIRPQLKSSRSAKFGSYGQTDIKVYQNCEFLIKGYVDAQNGFGAMIRSHYNIHLRRNKAGWTVKTLQIQ
ncbi:MAG: hypothetical protein ABJG88_08865 [Litorimonas sp.]